MDIVLKYRPSTNATIEEMDRMVLNAAKTRIIRCYKEFNMHDTILDVGTLAGLRALAAPYNLKHITKALVRALSKDGFDAFWDKFEIH
jgi:hypothetical protein